MGFLSGGIFVRWDFGKWDFFSGIFKWDFFRWEIGMHPIEIGIDSIVNLNSLFT